MLKDSGVPPVVNFLVDYLKTCGITNLKLIVPALVSMSDDGLNFHFERDFFTSLSQSGYPVLLVTTIPGKTFPRLSTLNSSFVVITFPNTSQAR